MAQIIRVKGKLILRLAFVLANFILAGQSFGQAQCVTTGLTYTYHLGPTATSYCVTNGTPVGKPTCGSYTGTLTLQVVWNTGATTGSIVYGSSTMSFAMTNALVSGNITAGQTQNILYNTTPTTISCAASSGGICSGGTTTYSYQWMASTDNVTYNPVSGATSQNFTPATALTQTTYYKRQVVSSATNISAFSTVATIFVYPQLNGGSASPSIKNFSYNTSPGALTITGVSGGDGSGYTYQWQSSPDSVTWTNVASTTTSYTPGVFTTSYYFRVAVTNHGVTAYSKASQIIPVTGTITPLRDSVNYNTSPGQLRVSGYAGAYATNTFQWQSSPDSIIWTNLTGATDTVYTPLLMTATTYYRVSISLNGSPVISSPTAYVVVKIIPLTISAAVPTYQLMNVGYDQPSPISVKTVSGGACVDANSYNYQWQKLVSSTWTNITGANTNTYTVPTIAATTYFRLQVSVGSQTVYSNADTVGYESDSVSGPINLWTGETSNYLRFNVFEDTTAYRWLCTGCTFVTNPNTGLKHETVQWTAPGSKYISVTIFGGKVYTLHVYVSTLPLYAGLIGTRSMLFEQGTPFTIPCSISYGGNCSGVYTYQWQQSTDSVNYTNITGATGSIYSSSSYPAVNTYYRRKVTGGSDIAYSDTIKVSYFPLFSPGTISYSSTDSLPFNTAITLPINGTKPTGGIDTNYTYQWQSSLVGNISDGGGNQNYQSPSSMTYATGVYFTRYTTCGGITRPSNTILVPVKILTFDPGTLSPTATTVTSGSTTGLTGTSANGGTVFTYSYQWQQSNDEVNWTNCSGGTTQNFTTPALTKTTYFRRFVTNGPQSGFGNVNSYYNEIKIKVVATTGLNAPNATTQSTASGSITAIPVNPYTLSSITSAKINYVRNWEVEKPGITTLTAAKSLSNNYDYKQSTTYFDDLGREIQNVSKQASPDNQDLISVLNYDPIGRELQKYLIYYDSSNTGNFRTNAGTAQPAFYNNFYGNQEGYYYSNNIYDGSPLNRVVKSTSPGNSWTGSNVGIRTDYTFNYSLDSVKIWKIGANLTDTPTVAGIYSPGTLGLNITTDEHENKIMEYKDKEGKVILKKIELSDTLYAGYTGWLCTYYVYDVFNHLRYVLSPKATQFASSNAWTLNPIVRNELCFQYNFDQAGKLISRKAPGAGEVDMVYDARNRLVMTQDSLSRLQGKWNTTAYDSLNRVVKTASYQNSNSRSYHQNLAQSSIGYPTLSGTDSILIETFYDDYSWESRSDININQQFTTNFNNSVDLPVILSGANVITPSVTAQTRGSITGARVKILNNNTYLKSVNFFDDYNRTIQVHIQNVSTGWDTLTTKYDFSGKILSTCSSHSFVTGNGPVKWNMLVTAFNYDAQGRISNKQKYLNGLTVPETLNTIVYDKLGRIKTKSMGNNLIETLNYDYNIRNWLKGINRSYVSGATNSNWFGMDIGYDFGYNQTELNGNIAGIAWKSKGDPVARAYGYVYDNTNRLLKGDFTQNNGSGYVKDAQVDFNVDSLRYDANGNILSMQQKGMVVNSSQIIDHLQYTYLQSGGWSNKIAAVADNTGNTAPIGDFKDGTNTGNDYLYDGNGNLIVDSNKNIGGIIYNYLDLPQQIPIKGKGIINYVYDASGSKLKKIVTDSTSSPVKITTTTYSGAYIYNNDTLQFINIEEGRSRLKLTVPNIGYTPSNIQYIYDYYIKDHLGNTRMVLTEETQQDTYAATMEAANASVENALFDSVSSTQYVKPTGFDTDTSNHYVSRLNANATINKKVGPSIVLKVMAGDTLTASVYGWYNTAVQAPSGPATLINSLIPALVTSTIGASGGHLVAAEQATINSAFTSSLPSLINLKDASYSASAPKAFLNWALFDNRMNYVSGGVTQVPVITGGSYKQAMAAALPASIQKNGYLYIYVSNESPQDVYFDNLTIQFHHGPLMEETHYYPFGLTMSGISDKALKTNYSENKYRYNGNELQHQEFFDGTGLEEYDFGARLQDPQLGRFFSIDPHADKYRSVSPYVYVMNNPISCTDPTGMDFHLSGQEAQDYFEYWTLQISMGLYAGLQRPTLLAVEDAQNSANSDEESETDEPEWGSKGPFKVHQQANANAVNRSWGELTETDKYYNNKKIKAINAGTVWADKKEHQVGLLSFMHAMSDDDPGVNQTPEQAKKIADGYVRTIFGMAKRFLKDGKTYEAYFLFGVGLHTLQDATSPAHAGFQPWSSNVDYITEGAHVSLELRYPGLGSNLQQVTNTYLDWFEHGDTPLPKENLFDSITPDKFKVNMPTYIP